MKPWLKTSPGRWLLWLICGTAALTLVAPRGQAAAPRPSGGAARAPKVFDVPAIDAYLSQQVKQRGLVGLSAAMVRDGQLVLAQGYGQRSASTGGSIGPATRFAIGSVTKQFACACVLLLADQQKLSVRDPVAKYYPELTRAADITLLDLMHHVSGYPDYYPLDFLDRRMKQPITPDALIRRYAGEKLDFEPGTRWSYSNTGYVILGRVVERVSGQPFGQFLQERVLAPLGMHDTVYEPETLGDQDAGGHTAFALGPQESVPREGEGWLVAAGGLWSTPSDLAKWDLALIEGRLLRAETRALMTSPRRLADGRSTDYACGLGIGTLTGFTLWRHTGAVSGYNALNAVFPDRKSALVLLINSEDTAVLQDLFAALAPLLLPEPVQALPAIRPPALTAAQEFLKRLQRGKIDRARLGTDYSEFLDEAKLKAAARRLRALGAPVRAELRSVHERGGMEVTKTRFTFRSRALTALMYRSPDGQIQQYLLLRED